MKKLIILAIFTIAMVSCQKKEQCYSCTFYSKNLSGWKKGATTQECGADVKTNALQVEVRNKNMKKICSPIQ